MWRINEAEMTQNSNKGVLFVQEKIRVYICHQRLASLWDVKVLIFTNEDRDAHKKLSRLTCYVDDESIFLLQICQVLRQPKLAHFVKSMLAEMVENG